jgi:hypothetical protein
MIVSNNLLLAYKEKANNLKFKNKIISLEFTDIIGKMNVSHCVNPNKRNNYLFKYGKKLFRKHPLFKKKTEIRIRTWHGAGDITDEDIMYLLTPINKPKGYFIEKMIYKIKAFYRELCTWDLIISIDNIDYEFSLKGLVRIKHINKHLSFEEEQQFYKRIFDVQHSELPPEESIRQVDEIIAEVYTREVM